MFKFYYCLFIDSPGSGGSAEGGSCLVDDLDCLGGISDRLGMEAIRQLHRQLDDDDNGNIDISESDDVSTPFCVFFFFHLYLYNFVFTYACDSIIKKKNRKICRFQTLK